MHKLSIYCVQLVRWCGGNFVDTLSLKNAVCTITNLCARYTNVYTSTFHTLNNLFVSVYARLSHTIHTPYINSNILPRLLINTKHSGELL